MKFRAGINSILDNLRQRINEFAQEEQLNEDDDPNNLSTSMNNLEGAIKERKGTGGQNAVFE